MELRQLDYFVHVVQVGSFSGAAAYLGVPQPSLWRSVKALEAEVGVRLFERSGRGVTTTSAGRDLLNRAEQVLDRAAAFAQLGCDLAGGVAGLVTIDCAHPHVARFLAPLIGSFLRDFPDIRVALHEHPGLPPLDGVLDGTADLATGLADRQSRLARQQLGDVNLVLIREDDHPWMGEKKISTALLRDQTLLLGTRGSLTRQLLEPVFRAGGWVPRIAMESAHASTLVSLARQGIGVAVVADDNLEAGGGQWPHLVDPSFDMGANVWLYWAESRPHTPAVKAFIDHVRRSSSPSSRI